MTDRNLTRVRRAAVPRPSEQLAALGAVIRRRRIHAGLSQGMLAARACTSQQQISGLERGIWSPRLDMLWRIAGALGTCPSALLGNAEDALDGGRLCCGMGHTLNGQLTREGADQGDVERWVVTDGRIHNEKARLVWPGGSQVGL